ncbi:MAG TPA: hypothetical protein DDZ67_04335 [Xanthomonadaceae bacterium]|nr:hypothetical protein [Xanthomonadaceae bacterium]
MPNITLSRSLVLGLAATLALAGCKKKEETVDTTAAPAAPAPAAPAPTEAAPSVMVSSVTVGNNAAMDKSVAPVATLGTRDKIIVSIKTEGSANNVAVAAKLLYQDGQVAGEQGATLNTSGSETTNIEFSNANGWPAGKYRAEVSVDGKTVGAPQEFEVK